MYSKSMARAAVLALAAISLAGCTSDPYYYDEGYGGDYRGGYGGYYGGSGGYYGGYNGGYYDGYRDYGPYYRRGYYSRPNDNYGQAKPRWRDSENYRKYPRRQVQPEQISRHRPVRPAPEPGAVANLRIGKPGRVYPREPNVVPPLLAPVPGDRR